MNDYFFPMPQGLDAIRTRSDLERIRPIDIETSDWQSAAAGHRNHR